MNFFDIAKLILPIAPIAGSILGGLVGGGPGSFAGQKLGELLMSTFGVKTPTELAGAIKGNPDDVNIAKINAAMALARAEIEGFVEIEKAANAAIVASIEHVNATMRVEVLPENRHWFYTGWRPASGWVFVVHAAIFGCCLLYATVWDGALLTRIDAAWKIYAAFFGTLAAMVGVYVVARSADKIKGVDTSVAAPPAKPAVRR